MSARVFFFCAALFLLLTSREPPWADAHVTYDTSQALVDRHALDVYTEGGPPWFYAHRLGRKYGVFPLGNVVAMVPSYLGYKLLHTIPFLPEKALFALCAHLSPSLLMAGACALFFWLCRRRQATTRWALGLTLGLAFATQCFIYARSPYSEALQTLALTWLVERTLAQGERASHAGMGWLGASAGLLVNSKLVYALLLPAVAGYLLYCHRHALGHWMRRTPLALVAFGESILILLLHNRVKTGSLWQSGYQYTDGIFSGDFYAALYGFLFSTGKSVFFYSPILILGILGARTAWRRLPAQSGFLIAVIAIVVGFNAKFRIWHADYCWGPRYLTPIVPLVLLLALPWLPDALARGRTRLRRASLAALVAASLGVQLLGASFYWDHYLRVLIAVKDQTGAAGWFTEHLSHGHFIPEFSPIRGHAWMLSHLLRNDPALDRDAPWKPVWPAPTNLSEPWNRMRLDWWLLEWTEVPALPPRPDPAAPGAGLVLLALLVDLAALAGSRLREQVERDRVAGSEWAQRA